MACPEDLRVGSVSDVTLESWWRDSSRSALPNRAGPVK